MKEYLLTLVIKVKTIKTYLNVLGTHFMKKMFKILCSENVKLGQLDALQHSGFGLNQIECNARIGCPVS